jgi:hypothetical protein
VSRRRLRAVCRPVHADQAAASGVSLPQARGALNILHILLHTIAAIICHASWTSFLNRRDWTGGVCTQSIHECGDDCTAGGRACELHAHVVAQRWRETQREVSVLPHCAPAVWPLLQCSSTPGVIQLLCGCYPGAVSHARFVGNWPDLVKPRVEVSERQDILLQQVHQTEELDAAPWSSGPALVPNPCSISTARSLQLVAGSCVDLLLACMC